MRKRRRQVALEPVESQDSGERARQHGVPAAGPGGARWLGETKEEAAGLQAASTSLDGNSSLLIRGTGPWDPQGSSRQLSPATCSSRWLALPTSLLCPHFLELGPEFTALILYLHKPNP